MFGLSVKGSDSQLILGDDKPIVTQKYRGRLKVTQMFPAREGSTKIGICTVIYPSPFTEESPPMVFGIPTEDADVKGICYFMHEGERNNWTGFSIVITNHWRLQGGPNIGVGYDSGWDYSVCIAGDPKVYREGDSGYGLQLWGEDEGGKLYDSNWPLVTFKGLLPQWTMGTRVRRGSLGYWGYIGEASGSRDDVLIAADHVWGHPNGTHGILISSLGMIPMMADLGKRNTTMDCVVVVGFSDSGRSILRSTSVYPIDAQHPNATLEALNTWKLLVADFTHT